MEHQDIFGLSVEEMIKKRNLQYLKAWQEMFKALVIYSARERGLDKPVRTMVVDDNDSVATLDTMDLAEWLVDATDGMDREYDIAEE